MLQRFVNLPDLVLLGLLSANLVFKPIATRLSEVNDFICKSYVSDLNNSYLVKYEFNIKYIFNMILFNTI